MMHIRVDSELKVEAAQALDKMGLNMSEAVRVFLTRVVAEQALPFEVKVPNSTTQATMRELRAARRLKSAGVEIRDTRPQASGRKAVKVKALKKPGASGKGSTRRFTSVTALMADLNADD